MTRLLNAHSEGSKPMRQAKELMVPFSVIEKLNDMHYKHLAEMRKELTDHLEKVAALYERALNPPSVTAPYSGPLYSSEELEDEEYQAIIKAERRALEDQQKEQAFAGGDIKLT